MNKIEKRNLADKVLKSNTFYRSNVYHKLLDYLVEKNLQEEIPKEISVAEDVFNKGNEFNSSEDTTVRVHVHNLRKKLKEYYLNEGKNDAVRLSIPKGHYQLFFEKASNEEILPGKTVNRGKKFWITVSLIAIAWLLLAAIYLSDKLAPFPFEKIDTSNPIWSNYFENDLNTSIIIGDFLEFHETDRLLNRTRRIQDYQINEQDSLNQYIEKFPEREIEKWVIGELPHNSIFNIIDIYPLFLSFGRQFEIAFTSEIDIDYINNRNIIYIGEFKNLRILKNLTSALPFEIITLPWWDGQIKIKSDSSYTLETYHRWEKSRYVVDLGMIAKLPGQNGENYLICAGFGYNSQIKLIKLLATQEGLEFLEKVIEKSVDAIPEYFVTILEISGFDRASTKAEVEYFDTIADDYFNSTISTN